MDTDTERAFAELHRLLKDQHAQLLAAIEALAEALAEQIRDLKRPDPEEGDAG